MATFDEAAVDARARAFGDALVAGDVDAAIGELSDELRRNLGEVLSLFPLPATEAAIESIERGSSSYVVVMRLTGETSEDRVQTRWKDRAGSPKIVEASHLSQDAREAEVVAADAEASEADGEPAAPALDTA